MSFRDNLKRLREEQGYTQAEIADWLGVSRRTVEGWESGRRERIDLGLGLKLADLFGVKPEELLREETESE